MSRGSNVRPLIAGLGWLLVAVVALVSGLFVAGGAPEPAVQGLPSPDPLVAWGTPVLRLLTTVSALVTVGLLIVSRWTSSRSTAAPFTALVWVALALVQVFFVLANVLALPLADATSPAIVATFAPEIASTRALLAAALLAFIVSFGVITTGRSTLPWIVLAVTAAALPSMANHASGLGDHSLALTGNVAHAVAATIWVGALTVLTVQWLRRLPSDATVLASYSNLALACWLTLGISGVVNGYVRLERPEQLLTTGYGQLLIVKAVLLILIGIIGWRLKLRLASRNSVPGLAAIDLTLMATAVGLGVALASSAYPRLPVAFTTLSEALLGSAPPQAPTVAAVFLGYRIDPVFAVVVLLGLMLVLSRWRTWPTGQRLAWLAGLGALAWVTNGSPGLYAPVAPGWATVQVGLIIGPIALLLARGWPGRRPANLVVAVLIFIAMQIVSAVLGGWSIGAYPTRTLVLAGALAGGALFFWHMGTNRSGRLAGLAVVAVSIGLSALLGSRVASWFTALQPDWLTDVAGQAQFGAWLSTAVLALTVLIAQLWPGLPVSVDPVSPGRHTRPTSFG
jgi:putative copper export protein